MCVGYCYKGGGGATRGESVLLAGSYICIADAPGIVPTAPDDQQREKAMPSRATRIPDEEGGYMIHFHFPAS
jgi:hypothetical protein